MYIYIYIFFYTSILCTVYGVAGTRIFSNQWWMAGAGHLASLRGTGVGHYETAAPRSLQRQSCQPKVGLPATHQEKTNTLLPSRKNSMHSLSCRHCTHVNNTHDTYTQRTYIRKKSTRKIYTENTSHTSWIGWRNDIGFVID